MDLSDPDERTRWRERLGQMFEDRQVICAGGPLAAYTEWVRLLEACGARRPLLLAAGRGAGAIPASGSAEVVALEVPLLGSMTAELAALDGMLRHLPEKIRRRVEEYDTAGEACWLVPPFVRSEPILGRAVIGGRPAAWARLEDKATVESLWDAVEQPHAPHVVVPCDADHVLPAAAELDAGQGTVWVADGFNGGGELVRWVVTETEAADALTFFGSRARKLRVMPFLDGVPCSVHGIVLPDGTAAFRPVELAILRDGRHRFVYGGQGTTWSPPEADRREMRTLVRRTGEHLRRTCDYRGAFGIDGVLTEDGFRPTELNPRFSGGLAAMARGIDMAAFNLLHLNLVTGRDPHVGVEELESWALPLLDSRPFARALAMVHEPVLDGPLEMPAAWDGSVLRRDPGGDWLMEAAPTAAGIYVRLAPLRPLEPGLRLGELNVALMRMLDRELGTSFGALEAAPDVRSAIPTGQ